MRFLDIASFGWIFWMAVINVNLSKFVADNKFNASNVYPELHRQFGKDYVQYKNNEASQSSLRRSLNTLHNINCLDARYVICDLGFCYALCLDYI